MRGEQRQALRYIPAMATTFACDMTAIPADERPAHHELSRRLVAGATIRESASGFTFQFPAREYDAVTQFVARERLCCPFLKFTVEVTPDRGPLLLHLTGPAGAKEFISAELHLPAG
jgi:hypothetical protein